MSKKWHLPLSYIVLVLISVLPPITQAPYNPRNTQDVIFSILSIAVQPYQAWGWVFHVATLFLVLFILWRPEKAGRVLAGYMGVNYMIIAALQTHATTVKYGFALQTGALVGTLVIGITWLVVAIKDGLRLSLNNVPRWSFLLLPLVLLVFWSPVKMQAGAILPNFDPRLLLTSVDYGLSYCFVTPLFLFLLTLFSNNFTTFAFRISAFNGLLYGIFNLTHWFNPNTVWMGVMHLPLLILSIVALALPYLTRITREKPAVKPI